MPQLGSAIYGASIKYLLNKQINRDDCFGTINKKNIAFVLIYKFGLTFFFPQPSNAVYDYGKIDENLKKMTVQESLTGRRIGCKNSAT